MSGMLGKIIGQIKLWWTVNTTSARLGTILLILVCLSLSIGLVFRSIQTDKPKNDWYVSQPDKSVGMDKKVEQRYIAIIKDKDKLIKKLKIKNELLQSKDVIAETKVEVGEDTSSVRVIATVDDKGEGGIIVREEKAVVRLIPSIFVEADYLLAKSDSLGDWRFSVGMKGVKVWKFEAKIKGEVDTRNNWAFMGALEYSHKLGEKGD